MQKKNNLLLTGGHAAATATAVIQETKDRNLDCNLFWVGPRSAVEGKFVPTHASQVMEKMGVKFIPITAARLQKKFTIWTIPSILKMPVGIIQALKIILEMKPKIVISFGGYASVPICFWAWIFRIPVIIHEQTVAAGRANKLTSFFATKILIARQESKEYFPENKTILIGNPVSKLILKIKPKHKQSLSLRDKLPTIYITGGSSGAQRINKAAGEVLYDLLQNYKVIHQTGKLDFEEFTKKHEEFPADLRENYEVYDFIDPTDVYEIFERADIIITRAGANTLSEIMIAKRPAIIIPIPWTAYDEQTKNARLVEKTGLGVVLTEENLSGKNLLATIEYVAKNWQKMVNNFDPTYANLDKAAAGKFVDEVEKLL